MLKGTKLNLTRSLATEQDIERMSTIPYASAIGSIMYVTLCTRPDVALVVSMTNRFQSNPWMEHLTTVKNIQKYLKMSKDMSLVFGGNGETLDVKKLHRCQFWLWPGWFKVSILICVYGKWRISELEEQETSHNFSIDDGVGVHSYFRCGKWSCLAEEVHLWALHIPEYAWPCDSLLW
jgi:hypothetical protein